jgi:hypothetical protein
VRQYYSDTIRTIETARYSVILDYTQETNPDFSFDETGETAEKCNSGEWECVIFRVRVMHKETGLELSADYLGNSIYANPTDFAREHIGARGKWGSYYRDMVSQAIDEARATIAKLCH